MSAKKVAVLAPVARRGTPNDLTLDPANPNRGTERGREVVAESLRRLGAGRSIVVDKHGVAIAGNKTLEAARQMGLVDTIVVPTSGDTLVVVQRTDLDLATDARARELSVADNRASELGLDWDAAQLAAIIGAGGDLTAYFSDRELVQFVAAVQQATAGLTDADAIPAPPSEAVTARGDLYQLGPHRLMCGDSSSEADVDRLLGGNLIDLVHTDPPYNVKVEPRSNNAIAANRGAKMERRHHQEFDEERVKKRRGPGASNMKATHDQLRPKDRALINDWMTDEAFQTILDAWITQIARVLKPGRAFYFWGGFSNIGAFPPTLTAHGLHFAQAIIWNKQHPVLTRKDFMLAHEIAFYGWREGAAHRFFGPANIPDIWDVKKLHHADMVHLTEKPVELAQRALTYSSKLGERVLDLFGGSGSTLIAAQQLDRVAYLMELDPIYCDVIVQRWEQFTGQQASCQKVPFTAATHERKPTKRAQARPDRAAAAAGPAHP